MKQIGIIQATALSLLLGLGCPIDARQDKPDKQEEKAKPEKPERQGNLEPQKQDKPAKQEQQQQAKEQQDQQRRERENVAKQQRQDNSAKQQEQVRGQQDTERQQRDNAAKQQAKNQQKEQQQDNANRHEQQIARGQQDQQRREQQQRQDQASQRQEQARGQQVAWQDDRARSWKSEHRTWHQRGGYNGYRVPDDRFRSYYGQDHGFRIYSLPVRYVGGHRRFQYGGYWFSLMDPWPEYWSSDWYESDDVYVDHYDDGYYLYNSRYPGDRISISFYLN